MKNLARYALASAAASLLLAGCGGPQSPFVAPPTEPNALENPAGGRGDLLYIANFTSAAFLTFPAGKPIGQISGIGNPQNVCADASGNVWFTSYFGAHKYRLYEFAHGGTQPIATIDVPKTKSAVACAVNPVNGDLAVLSSYGGTSYGSVLVWAGARSGTPKAYPVFFNPTACDYDDSGNLLIAGWADSDGYFFDELKNGAAKVTRIKLNVRTFLAGSVRWDGSYFSIAVQQRRGSLIDRVKISGASGKVVQSIHPQPLPMQTLFWVRGDTMVATERSRKTGRLGIWQYVSGGKPAKSFPGLAHPAGLTVSRGSL